MRPSVTNIKWSDVLLHTFAELAIATITYFILVVNFPYPPSLYTILQSNLPNLLPAHLPLPYFILGYVVVRVGWFLVRAALRKSVKEYK